MTTTLPTRPPKPSEEGYILVAVMFMLALLVIAMSVAAPKVAKSIQRERELETMHRGKQYARAVKLYYKKFGAYPPNVDALVKTNEIRFLRKKYIDPTTGKDEWKIVRVGQQKTQTLGFFGQPIAGTGPVGGVMPGGVGTPGGIGQTGTSTIGGLSPSSGNGASSGPTDNGGGNGTTGSPTDPSSGVNGTGQNGTGIGTGGTGIGTGGTGSSGIFGSDSNGQTFGGIGIMGFSPTSPKQSILVYKKKNHYNEWEFLYDPIAEQMMSMGGGNTGTIGTPAAGMPGSSPIGSGSGFGGGSGLGGGSSFGGSGIGNPGGTAPTPPPPPPQQ